MKEGKTFITICAAPEGARNGDSHEIKNAPAQSKGRMSRGTTLSYMPLYGIYLSLSVNADKTGKTYCISAVRPSGSKATFRIPFPGQPSSQWTVLSDRRVIRTPLFRYR